MSLLLPQITKRWSINCPSSVRAALVRNHTTGSCHRLYHGSSSTKLRQVSSSMEADGYNRQSLNLYTAHTSSEEMLVGSLERMASRVNFEDMNQEEPKRRHIVDLGSADGSNSIKTLRFAINQLHQPNHRIMPLHVTFEEQPASDEEKLREVLESHDDWFKKNNVTRSILIKSFYKQLFEPNSVDFFMSYICLHWLDTSLADDIAEWKLLGDEQNDHSLGFTCINESTAPVSLARVWKRDLADVHLAKFFALRANELRPGAEALLVMVSHPHEFICPPDGGASPLTRAMQNCVAQGLLREKVLRRTIIPYFLRTVDDVKAAFDLASSIEINNLDGSTTTPGEFLELVDVEAFPAITGGGSQSIESVAELFWSIHSGAVKTAGPSEEELECIRRETMQVFADIYDSKKGVPSTFVACVIRRRTRNQWSK
mmetsp:Transcript_15338/g.27819  ORF Transcript_15338/g.27819 Transcript_15338/m.27819 type:complete len:428 (-) Transcript_15338:44-1327(-)